MYSNPRENCCLPIETWVKIKLRHYMEHRPLSLEVTEITAIDGEVSRDAEHMPSGLGDASPLSVASEPYGISHLFVLYGC